MFARPRAIWLTNRAAPTSPRHWPPRRWNCGQKYLPADDLLIADANEDLAMASVQDDRPQDAEAMLAKVLRIRRSKAGAETLMTADTPAFDQVPATSTSTATRKRPRLPIRRALISAPRHWATNILILPTPSMAWPRLTYSRSGLTTLSTSSARPARSSRTSCLKITPISPTPVKRWPRSVQKPARIRRLQTRSRRL